MVAHPPCTMLANSGARWLYQGGRGSVPDVARWEAMMEATDFFNALWRAPIPRIAIENPVMHRHAKERLAAGGQTQSIQPWQFGHGEIKRTCLWLKNLPPLTPTDIVAGREAKVHRMPPGPDRWRERSRTLSGIAAAMAAQWGNP